jgi:hypothetical protein
MDLSAAKNHPPNNRLYQPYEYPCRPMRDPATNGGRSQVRLASAEDFFPPRTAPEPGGVVLPATLLVEAGEDGSQLTSLEYAGLPLTREQIERHLLVVGATGSGKTYHTLYPAIAAFAEQTDHNLLLMNTKGPVATAEMAAVIQRHRPGCRVIVFAPGDPTRSVMFNPLAYARRHGMLDMLLQGVVRSTQEGSNDSGYWRATATRILRAVFKHAQVDSLDFARELLECPDELRRFLDYAPDPALASFLEFHDSGSHNAMTNITDIANRLAAFAASPEAIAVTSGPSEIDLHGLLSGCEDFALIIEANESTFESEAPLLNLFLSLAFRTVTKIAEGRPEMCLPRRLGSSS